MVFLRSSYEFSMVDFRRHLAWSAWQCRSPDLFQLCGKAGWAACPGVWLSCSRQGYHVFTLSHGPRGFAASPDESWGPRLDVLSEVLRVVRLDSAMFYNAEFSSP